MAVVKYRASSSDSWQTIIGTKGADGTNGIDGQNFTMHLGTVSLSSTWSGSGPYTQTVTVTGVTITANSLVDIRPDATALQQMIDDGCAAIYIDNNNGTLTAYAIGAATTVALTLSVAVTEVS